MAIYEWEVTTKIVLSSKRVKVIGAIAIAEQILDIQLKLRIFEDSTRLCIRSAGLVRSQICSQNKIVVNNLKTERKSGPKVHYS